MASWKRSVPRYGIVLDAAILDALHEEMRVTQLMYTTNINATMLKSRLRFLVEKGFVTEQAYMKPCRHRGHRLSEKPKSSSIFSWKITPKGQVVLDMLNQLLSMYGEKDLSFLCFEATKRRYLLEPKKTDGGKT